MTKLDRNRLSTTEMMAVSEKENKVTLPTRQEVKARMKINQGDYSDYYTPEQKAEVQYEKLKSNFYMQHGAVPFNQIPNAVDLSLAKVKERMFILGIKSYPVKQWDGSHISMILGTEIVAIKHLKAPDNKELEIFNGTLPTAIVSPHALNPPTPSFKDLRKINSLRKKPTLTIYQHNLAKKDMDYMQVLVYNYQNNLTGKEQTLSDKVDVLARRVKSRK